MSNKNVIRRLLALDRHMSRVKDMSEEMLENANSVVSMLDRLEEEFESVIPTSFFRKDFEDSAHFKCKAVDIISLDTSEPVSSIADWISDNLDYEELVLYKDHLHITVGTGGKGVMTEGQYLKKKLKKKKIVFKNIYHHPDGRIETIEEEIE